MAYSSSLSDVEWEILEPLLIAILPQQKVTCPAKGTKREIVDGVLYQLKNGCNWEDLPKDLPPYLGARSLAPQSAALFAPLLYSLLLLQSDERHQASSSG